VATWSEFNAASPALARAVHDLIFQYGPGMGYLATIRADGGPRVHPVSPVLADGGLYCFMIDSPKRRDLERDDRYALHAFPADDSDDEAFVSGRATAVDEESRRSRVAHVARAAPRGDWRLFELTIEVAMVTRHTWAPAAGARRDVWREVDAACRVA
jgi:pyridoxamine 5'-phosphate oxidase-like protein